MHYFFDASALVKRYGKEKGTAWVQSITDLAAGNTIYIAEITGVEVVSALERAVRTQSLSPEDAQTQISQFRVDFFAPVYTIIAVDSAVIACAMALIENRVLKAYDAVQLAAALVVNDRVLAYGLPVLTMVCADKQLGTASAAEGLPVEDPENH
jgi:predicted nucleic acid-binding protein